MASRAPGRAALLCISPSFAPETTPTAIRAGKLLEHLSKDWDITVITATESQPFDPRVRVERVRSWRPSRLLTLVGRLRLTKLMEWFIWPDESIFWVLPAILAGRRLAKEIGPSAIVGFMMPYSGGLAGIVLSRLTGLPLILNLDDSPTCSDMHPHFPTRGHYRLAVALEDFYARQADAIIYVSQINLDAARSRAPEHARRKFHLVRYGADVTASPSQPARSADFEIAYVGAMSGWWALIEHDAPAGRMKRLYAAWTRLGRYERVALDQRTSSPAIIGNAILEAINAHTDWEGRVKLTLYGNPYSEAVVARALVSAGIESVIAVRPPVPHSEVSDILTRADLLFLTLPGRPDGSEGGRISAKTYEYLVTDRPILAAVPRGENWNYLADKPGVWLVEPADRTRMAEIVAELAEAKFAGESRAFDRADISEAISYQARGEEFADAIRAGIEARQTR